MTARAPGVDILRTVAIAAVMLYHLGSHGVALPSIVEQGWMGVDLFFVLSGYLVGGPLLKGAAAGAPARWGSYVAGRALRILPAYFAVLLLYAMLPGWREADGMQPLWKYLTFTVNLWPAWGEGSAYSHAWSLCVEVHGYLLLPVLARLAARRGPRALAAALLALLALLAAGMLLRAWLWAHLVAPALAAGDGGAALTAFVEQIYDPTWTRLDGLLCGVMLAAVRIFAPAGWTRLMGHGRLMLALGVAMLALCTRIPPLGFASAVALFPLAAAGCACLLAGALSPATFIGRRPLPGMRQGALLAYSLYLTHKEVYGLLDGWLPGIGARLPAVAVFLYGAASVAVAALLYVAVERPGMRLRSRINKDDALDTAAGALRTTRAVSSGYARTSDPGGR